MGDILCFVYNNEIQILVEDGTASSTVNLDVTLKIKNQEFKSLSEYNYFTSSIKILDVRDNGYNSGFQSKGIGTILINTTIQFLKKNYPPKTKVYGTLSTNGDPIDEETAENCKTIRKHFWETFGFKLDPGDTGNENFMCPLIKLKLNSTKRLLDKYSCLVDIQNFQPVKYENIKQKHF